MTAIDRAGLSLWAWRLTWFSWALLLVQQLGDVFGLQPPWVIWVGKLLPLVLFLPGMLRDRLRSFIWLCFVSLLYFIALVERLFATPQAVLPWLGMVAVVTLFCSAMFYVRWRARELQPPATATDPESPV
ncbi:MAG: DUF2069 domain-containing protein [Haliea sp.]|uniref:DUF2069 domain-containing protein n=1 Tax=Haliea sp. TaxID=1932666 RepID=UPI0032EECE8C